MNREMLKEAIAEAKTIKETAIASAKAALEEAFAPQLTALYAERLNEMNEEEDAKNENYGSTTDEAFDLEEILAELGKVEDDSEMKKEGTYENLDEDLMLEEMSDEDIEELVTSVIDDMIASGKLMAGEEEEEDEMEMDMDDMEDMDMDMDMEDGEEEIEDEDELKIDELLAEILGEEEEVVKENVFDKIVSFFRGNVMTDFEASNKDIVSKWLNSGKTDADKKEFRAAFESWMTKNQIASEFKTGARTAAEEKFGPGLFSKGVPGQGKMGFEEAKEMEETINELRNELNEVNLLNAKLLYTNKIFKAKNLTESEKVKVLNTFDKAETVKEVKLVFETLNESFRPTAKKSAIKESLGSASRSIAHATPKQPIIEVNDAFARMQRLAGIKK